MKSKKRATPQREVRTITSAQPMTVRTTPDGSKQIQGYAIVFNSKSVDLGGFTEIVAPTALDRTLRENKDTLALRDHRSDQLLGRTTANTLKLSVDNTGLAFTITLPQTSVGDDTAENVRLRNLTGCSFGFRTVSDEWSVTSDNQVVRTLLDIDLFEISITSFPAYAATSVTSLRSCPIDIRSRISRRDANDDLDCEGEDIDDPDCQDETNEDSDTEECSCRCERCVMDDCRSCYNTRCEDRACGSNGCQAQADNKRSDALRVRTLFAHRLEV